MRVWTRNLRRAVTFAALALVTGVVSLAAQKPAWYAGRDGLALGGYDAVAYFTDSRAVQGQAAFEHAWGGARWRFASAANRDRFAREPQTFAPQFGGYCAYAVSRGYTASADPEAWSVVRGKLYVNYSRAVRQEWEENIPGNIARGEANWPGVLRK